MTLFSNILGALRLLYILRSMPIVKGKLIQNKTDIFCFVQNMPAEAMTVVNVNEWRWAQGGSTMYLINLKISLKYRKSLR